MALQATQNSMSHIQRRHESGWRLVGKMKDFNQRGKEIGEGNGGHSNSLQECMKLSRSRDFKRDSCHLLVLSLALVTGHIKTSLTQCFHGRRSHSLSVGQPVLFSQAEPFETTSACLQWGPGGYNVQTT